MTHGLQIRLSDPAQYQSIVDAEWNIIYDKLQKCADSGAKVVLSRLAIGDLGTQFFADRDIFCAGRVSHLPCQCTWHLEQGQAASRTCHDVQWLLNRQEIGSAAKPVQACPPWNHLQGGTQHAQCLCANPADLHRQG